MLAVFDNDGTICDTQGVEGRCYAEAIEAVLEQSLSTTDWTQYVEATSTAILDELIGSEPNSKQLAKRIEHEFLQRLIQEQPKYPDDFSPLPGAIDFINLLGKDPSHQVAIATGCWASSARFKLACCGIELNDFPHATSSDTPNRKDIISLAIERSNCRATKVIYFGDAPWDVIACKTLEIPFIGIGRRTERLKAMGAAFVFDDYTQDSAILEAMEILSDAPSRSWKHTPRSFR